MSWSIESGRSHYCDICNTRWYDSDGGCSCSACVQCGEIFDQDALIDGLCEKCIKSNKEEDEEENNNVK